MKDRPNEEQLIGYLYGELSEKERAEFEAYMSENPDFKEEVEELGGVRNVMSQAVDIDVPEPTLIIHRKTSFVDRFSKTWMSIAAALLIVILSLFATGFSISSNDSGIQLSFGNGNGSETYSKSEVEAMMAESMESINKRFDNFQSGLENSLTSYQEMNEERIDAAYERISKVSQSQIAGYVEQLDRNQKEEIEKLFTMSQEQQQVYFSSILTDFTTYIEQQRDSDLENIQTYLSGWQADSEEKQRQTEQILASIISQVNNQTISD